jgi:hypothetical protein
MQNLILKTKRRSGDAADAVLFARRPALPTDGDKTGGHESGDPISDRG